MFIGYQDVELRVYDDQSEDFYDYLEDSEPQEEDEFIGRFVKRKLRNKKKLIKNSLFGFGGMGMGARIGIGAAKGLRKSIRKRKRRKRKSRRKARITAQRKMRELKSSYRRKSPRNYRKPPGPRYPISRKPIKRKLPKNWGAPLKAPVINIPKIRKRTTTPAKSYASPKSTTTRSTQMNVSANAAVSSTNQPITQSEGFDNLGERLGTDKPKQAGMGKSIIWVVVIVGGLIVVTKVLTGKKTSEIVKVKQAA